MGDLGNLKRRIVAFMGMWYIFSMLILACGQNHSGLRSVDQKGC